MARLTLSGLSRAELTYWLNFGGAPEQVEGVWLDAGQGFRAALRVPVDFLFVHTHAAAEAEISLRAADGILTLQVVQVRQTVVGASPVPRKAWTPIVRKALVGLALKLPPQWTLAPFADGSGATVRCVGVTVTGLTVGAESLSVEIH